MLMGGGSKEQIRRANEELEDLLHESLTSGHSDRLSERPGSDAQRPLNAHLRDSNTDRLLASEEWHNSVLSSRGGGNEPSLLGSGWSWHNPREVQDFLSTGNSLNNTADSETLAGKVSRLSTRATRAAEDALVPSRSLKAAPAEHALPYRSPGSPPSEHSSRFTTSDSESGDDWSASDDDNALASMGPVLPDSIIGRGAFGSVYKTTWKGQPAALKVIEHEDELGKDDDFGAASDEELEALEHVAGGNELGSSLTATQANQALLEAAMSSAVCHPNVVQTYHYRTVEPSENLASSNSISRAVRETHILMEFCDCGSLEAAVTDGRLADAGGADINLGMLCLTLLEVARAMEYLHKLHITHRDLKLANVLLKSAPDDPRGFTAKVSDFGLSRLLPDSSPKVGQSSGDYTGTITHMAPELLERGGMSRAADVYSFGILMWEALMGESAYQGISKMQVMFGVVSEGLRPTFPANTPPWYAQIATACWRQEPRRRPSFSKICERLGEQLVLLKRAMGRQ